MRKTILVLSLLVLTNANVSAAEAGPAQSFDEKLRIAYQRLQIHARKIRAIIDQKETEIARLEAESDQVRQRGQNENLNHLKKRIVKHEKSIPDMKKKLNETEVMIEKVEREQARQLARERAERAEQAELEAELARLMAEDAAQGGAGVPAATTAPARTPIPGGRYRPTVNENEAPIAAEAG